MKERYRDVSDKKSARRLNLIENQLAALPYLLDTMAHISKFFIAGEVVTGISQSPQYLLVTRSAYAIVFGVFSPAIWLLNESPKFLLDISGTASLKFEQKYSQLKNNPEFMNFLNKMPKHTFCNVKIGNNSMP